MMPLCTQHCCRVFPSFWCVRHCPLPWSFSESATTRLSNLIAFELRLHVTSTSATSGSICPLLHKHQTEAPCFWTSRRPFQTHPRELAGQYSATFEEHAPTIPKTKELERENRFCGSPELWKDTSPSKVHRHFRSNGSADQRALGAKE